MDNLDKERQERISSNSKNFNLVESIQAFIKASITRYYSEIFLKLFWVRQSYHL